jgi:hypothetical protein
MLLITHLARIKTLMPSPGHQCPSLRRRVIHSSSDVTTDRWPRRRPPPRRRTIRAVRHRSRQVLRVRQRTSFLCHPQIHPVALTHTHTIGPLCTGHPNLHPFLPRPHPQIAHSPVRDQRPSAWVRTPLARRQPPFAFDWRYGSPGERRAWAAGGAYRAGRVGARSGRAHASEGSQRTGTRAAAGD